MRVLIVDDSAFMRKALTQIVQGDPSFEVVGVAHNGKVAVEKALSLKPDIITLDIEMPEMDGMAALRAILSQCPDPKPAVVMCSSLTQEGSATSLQALRLGAADVIGKPSGSVSLDINNVAGDLLAKLRAICQSRAMRIAHALRPEPAPAVPRRVELPSVGSLDAILIGSSTGGPPVVEEVLTRLPPGLPPIVIAQHMPRLFTQSMAERLTMQCGYRVHHLTAPSIVRRGEAYICEGGRHVRLTKGGGEVRAVLTDDPKDALYKPCVNVLFSSAANCLGGRCLAIVLTGMGDDGAEGARELRAAGAMILAQNQATCVVYGMPRAVVQQGLASAAMTPGEVRSAIVSLAASSDKQSA